MILKRAMLSDGTAVDVINEHAVSNVIFVCEHASNYFPQELNQLGLSDSQAESHIAWDPGALAVATLLSAEFDAPLVASTISRLVYDCNRPPSAKGAIATQSESQEIPGNIDLSSDEIRSRIELIYNPFCQAIDDLANARSSTTPLPVIVTIHSFEPVYEGKQRDVEVGILHDDDTRLADCMLKESEKYNYKAQRNEPYGPSDGVTHTLQARAIPHGYANVMIEIRNDLITNKDGIKKIASYLARLLQSSLAKYQPINPQQKGCTAK